MDLAADDFHFAGPTAGRSGDPLNRKLAQRASLTDDDIELLRSLAAAWTPTFALPRT